MGNIFKKASKTALGSVVTTILPIVEPLVIALERDKSLTGFQKAERVKEAVKLIHGDIESIAINLAINLTLAIIREGIITWERE